MNFIVALAATAIGVYLALRVQKNAESSKRNKDAEEVKNKIKEELAEAIVTIRSTREQRDSLFLSPIKTPVFKAYVNSTKITLLDKYDWYKELLILYKYIDDINSWHNLKTDKSYNTNTVHVGKIDDGLRLAENSILDSDVIDKMN